MKKHPRIENTLYLLFILITISSCTLIPCSSYSGLKYVKENPKTDFLVGTYKIDDWTLDKTQGYENSQDARLIINSDGTFQMVNIHRGTIDFRTPYEFDRIKMNANGEWKTYSDKRSAEFSVNFKFEPSKTDLRNFGTTWGIYEKDKKAVIFIRVGDPDECSSVRFIKI